MNNEAEHIEYLDLIVKELSGEISPEERSTLVKWVEADIANLKVFEEYQKVWKDMDKVAGRTSPEVDKEWQRLETAINAGSPTNALKSPGEREKPSQLPWMRIAAAVTVFFALAAGVYFIINSNKTQEIVAEAQMEQIILPEGSVVSLNTNAKISFDKKFDQQERKVKMVGEAFFEVTRDTLRPFIIETGDIYVEVLGTAFNVKALPGDETIEVTVESGKVAVYRADGSDEKVILVKGQKATFKKTSGELVTTDNENVNFKAWKTRKIIFEDTPMHEVVRIVNEIYASDLQLANSSLGNCPVTTEFDGQSLETVIEVLATTLDLTVEKKGKTTIISGAGC